MVDVPTLIRHDHWAGVDGIRPAGPFILRFRTPILAAGEIGDHVQLLIVVWAFAKEDTGTLPTDRDTEEMRLFEDRLCSAWERDSLAVLVGVLTFDGARQWVFYTRDVAECGVRLHAMPQEEEAYPIDLTTEPDDKWDYFRTKIMSGIKWQKHQRSWREAALKSIQGRTRASTQ